MRPMAWSNLLSATHLLVLSLLLGLLGQARAILFTAPSPSRCRLYGLFTAPNLEVLSSVDQAGGYGPLVAHLGPKASGEATVRLSRLVYGPRDV